MKKLAIVAVCIGALGLLGCGGGSNDDDDDIDSGVIIFIDADTTQIDSGGGACNPVVQTGCDPGEKCTWIIDQAEPTLLAYTGCAEDGDKPAGQACTAPNTDEGEVGFDDCVAGYLCMGGTCGEICTTAPDSCGEGFACSVYSETFLDMEGTGVCDPTCDPVLQDCEGTDGCYLWSDGRTTCAGTSEEVQDEMCAGPSADSCYVNGCAEGFGPWQPDGTCSFFCAPVDNYMGNAPSVVGNPDSVNCASEFADRPNGPGPSYECKYLQSFYSGGEVFNVGYGFCLNPEVYGSCADFDMAGLVADINNEVTIDAAYCEAVATMTRCYTECVSLATFEAQFPEFRKAEVGARFWDITRIRMRIMAGLE